MKTIKQVAEDLGLPKQRVYRYIKNHITDVHHEAGTIWLNDAIIEQVKQHFNKSNDVHHDVHQTASNDTDVIQQLNIRISDKDNQIDSLNLQIVELTKLLDQEQRLHMATKQEKKLLEGKKRFRWPWQKEKEEGENL